MPFTDPAIIHAKPTPASLMPQIGDSQSRLQQYRDYTPLPLDQMYSHYYHCEQVESDTHLFHRSETMPGRVHSQGSSFIPPKNEHTYSELLANVLSKPTGVSQSIHSNFDISALAPPPGFAPHEPQQNLNHIMSSAPSYEKRQFVNTQAPFLQQQDAMNRMSQPISETIFDALMPRSTNLGPQNLTLNPHQHATESVETPSKSSCGEPAALEHRLKYLMLQNREAPHHRHQQQEGSTVHTHRREAVFTHSPSLKQRHEVTTSHKILQADSSEGFS